DVARGEAPRAQAGEHDVGEILTDTAARLERLEHRGADGGGTRRVTEITMYLVHQQFRTLQQRAVRNEAFRAVVGERVFDPHKTRFHPESTGVEFGLRYGPPRIVQCGANLLPGLGFRVRRFAARTDLDADFRQHLEAIVRLIIFETRHEIAERIDILAARRGLRIEGDRARTADLV